MCVALPKLSIVLLALIIIAGAQEQKSTPTNASPQTNSPAQSSTPGKVLAWTPSAKLASAKTVFLKRTGGSEIPFNVISSAFEGWGHYTVIGDAQKADLVVEILSLGDNSVTVSSNTTTSPITGRDQQNSSTTRQLSVTEIKMTVLDSRSKAPLWSGSEKAKFALRAKAREDNAVQAAEKLFSKFRDKIEP